MRGMGSILHWLGGGSEQDPAKFYGRTVVDAVIVDNRLSLSFSDGSKIGVWDNGQSCCESRYMSTDDDVKSLVGHKLVRIEGKPGADQEGDYEEHETCFVEVATDDGFITIVNHNKHNGYYGGFGLTVTLDTPGSNDGRR